MFSCWRHSICSRLSRFVLLFEELLPHAHRVFASHHSSFPIWNVHGQFDSLIKAVKRPELQDSFEQINYHQPW